MNHSLRHDRIFAFLRDRGTISITELAGLLDVSAETVRRDIRTLAARGELLRMHGAVGLRAMVGEAPFERRMRENPDAKRMIATTVAASIRDGDSVMLDTGTTTSFLAQGLLGHRRLTVVTNSSDIARTLATVNGNRVHMAGGELRGDCGAAFGMAALEFIGRFSVDHVVISAGAVNAETGIMDHDLSEAEFARVALTRGARRVVITDASKFGRRGLVQVCDFNQVDELVTEKAPPREIGAAIAEAGMRLVLAEGT